MLPIRFGVGVGMILNAIQPKLQPTRAPESVKQKLLHKQFKPSCDEHDGLNCA